MPSRAQIHRAPGWRQRPAWERSAGQQSPEHPLPASWANLATVVSS
jgi:hypothetical protein